MKKYLNAVIVLIAFHSINVISQDDVEEIVVTSAFIDTSETVSYTHLRAHETV